MKFKALALVPVLLLTMLFAVSCGDESVVGGDESGYVFTETVQPKLVFASDTDKTIMNSVYNEVKSIYGEAPEYSYGDDEEGEHEIVIGRTDRSISRKAYRKLRLIQKNSDYEVAYLVYASGNSVAVVFDEESENRAAIEGVDYFVDTYLSGKTSLKLSAGIVYSNTFSVLERLEEYDNAVREEKYQELANYVDSIVGPEYTGLGKDIANAFRSLYSIYDSKVVTWFANLYDPAVGGYYFSNSARDNEGFLPDIESTAQALGFISSASAGITLGKDSTSYRSFIPEDMRREIIIYLRGLQDKNGFFYHTQWSKEDTDAHLSRRARDLGNAVSVLKGLGSRPRYDTPNGDKAGDGTDVIPDSLKGTALGSSVSVMVSKVVLTAAYDPRYESLETLNEYLQGEHDKYVAGKRSFYAIGNEITSQMSQIKKRDIDLGTSGTAQSLVARVIEWFNEHQNPENGLWEPESNYLGVNGLLKISGVYNKAGALIPHAGKAAQAAIDAITSDQQMSAVVDLYNTWFAVNNVINNLTDYGEAEGAAQAQTIRRNLLLTAAPAIIKSGVKMHDFEKPDGSYSYGRYYSSTTSQGMPVSIPNSVEGDVNGTVIAINGLVGNIYNALGLSKYTVPIFGSKEGRIYYDILVDLEPVQKITSDDVLADYPIEFDDDVVGDAPSDVTLNLKDGSSITVEQDSKWGSQVLQINSKADNADSVVVPNNGAKKGTCYVFEADYCVNSVGTDNAYFLQVTMGDFYMYSLKTTKAGVEIFEATTSSSSTAYYNTVATMKTDEWFNVRVEYYVGDAETVRIKFYVNDSLVSVSDYYYKRTKTESDSDPAPNDARFDSTKLYCMKTPGASFCVDNVHSYSTSDVYTPATDKDTDLVYNIDAGLSDAEGDTEGGVEETE